jgi:hypothetical protein
MRTLHVPLRLEVVALRVEKIVVEVSRKSPEVSNPIKGYIGLGTLELIEVGLVAAVQTGENGHTKGKNEVAFYIVRIGDFDDSKRDIVAGGPKVCDDVHILEPRVESGVGKSVDEVPERVTDDGAGVVTTAKAVGRSNTASLSSHAFLRHLCRKIAVELSNENWRK